MDLLPASQIKDGSKIQFPHAYGLYADEDVRRNTFGYFLNCNVSVEELAKSGFYYLGKSDLVQCFHCGIIIMSWEEGDRPDQEHQKHSSLCEFIKEKLEGKCTARVEVPQDNSEVANLWEKTKKLQEENEQLRSQQTCKICMDESVSNYFLPCGHVVCCNTCAEKLLSRECPLCKRKIEQTMPLYLT